jgi:hypothetical protein
MKTCMLQRTLSRKENVVPWNGRKYLTSDGYPKYVKNSYYSKIKWQTAQLM